MIQPRQTQRVLCMTLCRNRHQQDEHCRSAAVSIYRWSKTELQSHVTQERAHAHNDTDEREFAPVTTGCNVPALYQRNEKNSSFFWVWKTALRIKKRNLKATGNINRSCATESGWQDLTLDPCSKNWSSSVFFAALTRVKYESSATGMVTLDRSTFIDVAITYAWFTRRKGTPFTWYGPGKTPHLAGSKLRSSKQCSSIITRQLLLNAIVWWCKQYQYSST